jgi:hypothetical protein
MAKETQETQDLSNFSWDNGNEGFFNIEPETDKQQQTSTTLKQVQSEDDDEDFEDEVPDTKTTITNDKGTPKGNTKPKTEKKPESKEDDEEIEEDANFNSFGEEDEEDEDKVPFAKEQKEAKTKGTTSSAQEDEGDPDKKFFTQLTKEMHERGTFEHIEVKDDEEIDQEIFFEKLEEEVNSRVSETFEAFFEELDEDGKAFLKFKKDGGTTADFFRTYGNNEIGVTDFDPENKDQVKAVLQFYFTHVDKLDAEELQDKLDWLEENGKSKTYAEKYFNKINEAKSKQRAALLASQQQQIADREENTKKFVASLTETLEKTDEVAKFKFSKEDKKNLPSLITKPTVKVGKNKYIPSFNAKLGNILRAETPENKQKLLLLAKLVESDFDVKDLITEAETKVARKTKSKLQETKGNMRPTSSGSNNKKSLSDFF